MDSASDRSASGSSSNRRDPAAFHDQRLTIPLALEVSAGDPRLLSGLQTLLRLELISQRQIRLLAREQLCCRVPEPVLETPSVARASAPQRSEPARQPVLAAAESSFQANPSAPRRWLQSFMDELSVLWLLFLGVFLVVVSSAVLAASQWQNFSAVGQYLILLAYTVAFWGAGRWAGHQEKLQLTARMLQRVTLLLVPINFWAMDGFGLLSRTGQLSGWLVGIAATIALTVILLTLLRPRLHRTSTPKRLAVVTVALSWLHWGWAIAIMPLLASYVGMIGTAVAIIYDDQPRDREKEETIREGQKKGRQKKDGDRNLSHRIGLPSPSLIAILGALLLVGRAMLTAQVPLSSLGLAFGICGAVLAWRSRHTSTYGLWFCVGSGLMLLGWLTSLQLDLPWQPVAISLLALGIVAERLKRLRLPFDLTLLFLVGLQGLWLLRRFAPVELRAALVDRIEAIAGSSGMPFAVVGVTVFPYLLLFLGLGERFRQRGHAALARQANFLCLTLGAGLTIFSLDNGLMRPINLTLSAVTLGWVLHRRNLSGFWPYLTQALTWGACFSWFSFLWPKADTSGWLALTLVGALMEWALSLNLLPGLNGQDKLSWRRSAWHTGLGLSILSYLFALAETLSNSRPTWGLLWWVIPPALLAMVKFSRNLSLNPQPEVVRAAGISSLFLAQLLTIDAAPYRLAGFGLATLLMGMHSQLLPNQFTAASTLGFGIAFSFCLAFRGQPDLASAEQWMFALSAIALVLWALWAGLRQQSSRVPKLYARVANGWAIALSIPVFSFLLVETLTFYGGFYDGTAIQALDSANNAALVSLAAPSGWTLATTALATLSMVLCLKVHRHEASVYGLALGAELLLGLGIATVGVGFGSRLNTLLHCLAIANLIIALLVQITGEFQLKPSPRTGEAPSAPLSTWHSVPLGYAVLGGVLGHYPVDAFSGLFTIATAIITLGIGRRRPQFTPITYLALAGLSVGAYELLIYQLSQSSSGSVGDGIVLLGLLGAVLALGHQLLARWLLPYLHLEVPSFRLFTHIHWGFGSLFATIALILRTTGELSQTGGYLWMLTMVLLGLYALFQTRSRGNGSSWGWTDWGIVQLLSALGYGIHLLCPWPVLLGWAAAIACPVAILLQRFPWRRLGWSPRAGRRWAKLLPIILVILTAWDITIQSLLLVAAFYAGLSIAQNQNGRAIRLSYLSIGLVDWALLRVFEQFQLSDGLWYAGLLGITVLYVAQMDPALQSQRELRHGARCLGSGIVCFTALYQGQVGLGSLEGFGAGLVAIALSLVFVLAGLGLRIRAFLYVGTAAFLIQVLLQVWQFIQDESLLLWAIGIVLGLLLIWIAATFEARRSQVIAFINQWVTKLDSWQ